jgi:hypothetical protein
VEENQDCQGIARLKFWANALDDGCRRIHHGPSAYQASESAALPSIMTIQASA